MHHRLLPHRAGFSSVILFLFVSAAVPVLAGARGEGVVPVVSGTSYIPSGILYDRVLAMADAGRFDGSSGAPATSPALIRQLHSEMSRAAIDDIGWVDPVALREVVNRNRSHGVVSLAVFNVRYERLHANALRDGHVRAAGDGIALLSTEATETVQLFAVCAMSSTVHRGGEVEFELDSQLLFTNARRFQGSDREIAIDFGDGLGFRSITADETIHVSYAATGRKRIVAQLRGDAITLTSRFELDVVSLAMPVPDDTVTVTGQTPYNGGVASADAYVYLAPGNTVITQPAIVIEGFDLDNTMNWDELYALLNQENLIEDLRTDGFDTIILNFADATDYIQRNAFALVELVEYVQGIIGATDDFPIVGASMGGLVARYALAYMEDNQLEHRVRTYISFDTPHSGANIPLGVQYWLAFFQNDSADAAFLLSRLDRPAARQMLLYHWTDPSQSVPTADPLRATLQSDFAAIGFYPGQPRRVAIANGGSQTSQGFSGGEQIISYEYNAVLADVKGNVWAVPDGASTRIFEGNFFILFVENRSQDVSVSGTRLYDSAPGGRRDSMAEMDATEPPFGDIVALHTHHCFVPTISALDIATSDPFYDTAGDPNLLSITPFDAVYWPAANQDHVAITSENAQWLKDELEPPPTAIGRSEVPSSTRLFQNVPNPFNPSTTIAYRLRAGGDVSLVVYDAAGRRVATVLDGEQSQGVHVVEWSGTNDAGVTVASGVYFYRLVTGDGAFMRKMVLLK